MDANVSHLIIILAPFFYGHKMHDGVCCMDGGSFSTHFFFVCGAVAISFCVCDIVVCVFVCFYWCVLLPFC